MKKKRYRLAGAADVDARPGKGGQGVSASCSLTYDSIAANDEAPDDEAPNNEAPDDEASDDEAGAVGKGGQEAPAPDNPDVAPPDNNEPPPSALPPLPLGLKNEFLISSAFFGHFTCSGVARTTTAQMLNEVVETVDPKYDAA